MTGAFTDATTVALYLSDLAFLVLLAAWISWRKQRNAPLAEGVSPSRRALPRSVRVVLTLLVAWAFLRALPLHPSLLGWYAAVRILQGILLLRIAADLFQIPRYRRAAATTVLFVAALQSLLVGAQVALGHDLGLRVLGEPPLSLSTGGVAKVDILNHNDNSVKSKVLRGYGTFPHPNVAGSFLVLALASGFYIYRSAEQRSAKPNIRIPGIFIIQIALVSAGTFLTFSRSAWVSLALLLTVVALFYIRMSVDRQKSALYNMAILTGFFLPVLVSPQLRAAAYSRIVPPETDQYLKQRVQYNEMFVNTIQGRLLVGAGSGNSVPEIVRTTVSSGTDLRSAYEYDVPHSVPLVIVLDLGLVGFALILLVPILLITQSVFWHEYGELSKALVLGIAALPFLLFDKFLWTIQQGRILFWVLLGVLAAASLCFNRNQKTQN